MFQYVVKKPTDVHVRTRAASADECLEEENMPSPVDPMKEFLQAIERERRAWDALQNPPHGTPPDTQPLYAAWVIAVNSANLKAERFLQANRSRRRAKSSSVQAEHTLMSAG